jgi:hypothetical protein
MMSPTREEERKERLWYLEQMEEALKAGHLATAKYCGEMSGFLKERIEGHDYSSLDDLATRMRERAKKLEAKLKELGDKPTSPGVTS